MRKKETGVADLVPYVHVEDVERSARFYAELGFEAKDSHEVDGERVWCWLERGRARLMLARADAPVVAGEQAVLFYLYARDLEAVHGRLAAAGLAPGPIESGAPGPATEFRVLDPDGYCLMVADAAALGR